MVMSSVFEKTDIPVGRICNMEVDICSCLVMFRRAVGSRCSGESLEVYVTERNYS